jgi:hypothetical protein
MTFISGPRLSTSSYNTITGEDHLGIKNTAIIIADTLQSGITSITPRARYWAFYAWVLHDFIQTQQDKSIEHFKTYIKKQEWYFILANLAYSKKHNITINQLVGVTKGIEIWDTPQDEIPVHYDYLKNSFGGFNIYRTVMKSVGITREGDIDRGIQLDRLTPTGKKLAELFQKNVETTRYFKEWRHLDRAVPRDVLLEFGEKAALCNLESGFEKDLLKKIFLPEKSSELAEDLRYYSMFYYMHIVKVNKNHKLSHRTWRWFMYDVFSPLGEDKKDLPAHFIEVARGWELFQGRQMFTYSLESIWSYILDLLSIKTQTKMELVKRVLTELDKHNLPINISIDSLLETTSLKSENRENFLQQMRTEDMEVVQRVWNPLLVMLDIYNRFKDRDEFQFGSVNFKDLGGADHLSLTKWEKDIEVYRSLPASTLIEFLIRSYILQQHKQVALNKVLTSGNDTFHFVENEGRLHFLKRDRPSFNVFRVDQAMTILEDLGQVHTTA